MPRGSTAGALFDDGAALPLERSDIGGGGDYQIVAAADQPGSCGARLVERTMRQIFPAPGGR